MSNDSSPVGGARGFDSDALEQWVTETAQQKGVSKQQLLDEILSSYWVLEELSGVVSGETVTGDSRATDNQSSTEPADSQQSASRRPTEQSTSQADEFSELKTELQSLRGAIEELSTENATTTEASAETEVSALERQLDDLSAAVVDRQTETDDTVGELSVQLETVESRLSELETRLDTGMSLAELREAVGETNSAQTDLEARIESEFDSIEKVLQHLLDTTDNIEYRLGAVSDSRQDALRPLQERNAMRDELVELKQEALRHEVKTCVCDSCEQSIDLGLLERPECPSCEKRFTGISKGGWLPFSKPNLKTTDRSHEPRPQQSGAPEWSPSETPASESTPDDHQRTDW